MAAEPGARHPVRQLLASVRFRVTAAATLAVLAVLVATSVALVAAERRSLTDNLEETTAQRADELAAMVRAGALPTVLVDDEDTRAQAVTLDGRVLSATPSLLRAAPIDRQPPPGQAQVQRTVRHLPGGDGAFRVLSRRVEGRGGPVILHVAGALDDVDQSSRILATALAVTVPVVTVILALLVWSLVGRTLRPVEALRTQVASMSRTPPPGSASSSPTPPTSYAARSPVSAPSWRSTSPTRAASTRPPRSAAPWTRSPPCNGWSRTCSTWPAATPAPPPSAASQSTWTTSSCTRSAACAPAGPSRSIRPGSPRRRSPATPTNSPGRSAT